MLLLVDDYLEYKMQIIEMMEEWNKIEKIIPYSIRRVDYHDFNAFVQGFQDENQGTIIGMMKGYTYFLYDTDSDIILGAINIRPVLNDYLLMHGGHIGYGIRPSKRHMGYATKALALGIKKCVEMSIDKVLVVCDKENLASAKVIIKNGGILENEVLDEEGQIEQRYWINLS